MLRESIVKGKGRLDLKKKHPNLSQRSPLSNHHHQPYHPEPLAPFGEQVRGQWNGQYSIREPTTLAKPYNVQ